MCTGGGRQPLALAAGAGPAAAALSAKRFYSEIV